MAALRGEPIFSIKHMPFPMYRCPLLSDPGIRALVPEAAGIHVSARAPPAREIRHGWHAPTPAKHSSPRIRRTLP